MSRKRKDLRAYKYRDHLTKNKKHHLTKILLKKHEGQG